MSGQGPPSIYEFGELRARCDAAGAALQGRPAGPADARAYSRRCLYLVGHAGQLIEKSTLIEAIWPRVVVEEGSLSQAIYELRRALGERPDEHRFIVTVPGRGYQFVAEVTRARTTVDQDGRDATAGGCAQPATGAGRFRIVSSATWSPPLPLPTVAMAAWYAVDMRALGPAARTSGRIAPTIVATVAVLPFVDLSPQRDQQHLSDGLSEELIHLLAQNPSLRVLSRTSSFSFRNQTYDVATIARKLGATHVVEGSVRKGGERIRVAVQARRRRHELPRLVADL